MIQAIFLLGLTYIFTVLMIFAEDRKQNSDRLEFIKDFIVITIYFICLAGVVFS